MGKYFGTDGVRGMAGTVLTASMAYRIGRYIGYYGGKKNILLGRDTRLSGPMLSGALVSGIASSGSNVVDLGVTTTPSISYLVSHGDFDYGVMVSASHNPYFDNGIKIFAKSGEKLGVQIEEKIEEYMDRPEDDLPLADKEDTGRYISGGDCRRHYVEWLREKAPSANSVRLLVDLANGSASNIVPELFSELGYRADFISGEPNGTNINDKCGATHLETLQETFAKGGYDLAFSYDGDSDRFMGIAPGGRVIDGDAVIYLLALKLKKEGKLKGNKVVITVMSNYGLRKALEEKGIGYETVPVGDKYVQADLKEHGLSVGGEQSGHVIIYDDLNTGDGILTSLAVLDIFENHKDVFARLCDFKVYPQVLENISYQTRAEMEERLGNPEVQAAFREIERKLGNEGRLLVRTSGTENLIRVMAEHLDDGICRKAVDEATAALKE